MTALIPTPSPTRSETLWPVLALALVLLHTLYMCVDAATSGSHWVAMLYDDFFYYMKVAENWVDGHGSTFNRLVPTNGYHPLWMLVLAGAYALLGGGVVLFYVVCAVCVVSAGFTFHLVRKLAQGQGVPPLWASVVGVYITAFSLRHYVTGMEAILCLPLMFWFLNRVMDEEGLRSPAATLGTGLVGAAMVLSRLDAAVLVMVVAAAALLTPAVRQKLTLASVLAAVLGLSPVAIYVATNMAWFGTFMPVSGMAKQLMPVGVPSGAVAEGIWSSTMNFRANVVFWLLALGWATVRWASLSWRQRVLWAGMAFPLVYFTLLSFRSDWWLSDWYLYPVRVAVACGLALLLSSPAWQGLLSRKAVQVLGTLAVAVVLVWGTSWKVNAGQLAVYQTAAALVEFEKTHPGIYAMGDRAGKVGYLMQSPVVQLEGLVMDKDFLAFMKRSAPLDEVLRHYKADYYVGSSHEPFERCFTAVEPYQSGTRSPRVVGEFCEPPMARFTFGGVETLIYKVPRH